MTVSATLGAADSALAHAAFAFAAVQIFTGLAWGASSSDREAKRRVALFPLVVRGEIATEVVDAVTAALTDEATVPRSVQLVTQRELRRILKGAPLAAVAKCDQQRKSDRCFARLVRRLHCAELLLGRLTSQDGETRLLVLAIKGNRGIEARARLSLADASQVRQMLDATAIAAVYGAPAASTPPTTTTEAIAAADQGASAAPPSSPTAAALLLSDGPSAVANAASEETTAAASAAPAEPEAPAPTPTLPDSALPDSATVATKTVSAFSASPLAPDATRIVPVADVKASPLAAPSSPWWLSAALRYGGLAAAGVGLAAAGYGVHLGRLAKEQGASIESRRDELLQLHAAREIEDARALASRANTLLLVGAIAVTLGGSSWLADTFWLGAQQP